jgi:glutathione S-transferase
MQDDHALHIWPAFGLPDPSPFVTKAEVLLKMAGLAYRIDNTGFRRAPKGTLPYIDDDGERIADSTFIRWHLENKYHIDLEKLSAARPTTRRLSSGQCKMSA